MRFVSVHLALSSLLVACAGSRPEGSTTAEPVEAPRLPAAPAWCTTDAAPPPRFDRAPSRALPLLEEMQTEGADRQAALQRVEAILAGHPDDSEAHFVRGRALGYLGRTEEATVAFARALEIEPRLSDAAYWLGLGLSELGRNEEALSSFANAARVDPTFVNAQYNAGQIAYGLGRYELALEHFLCAHANATDDFRAATKVVQALHALGRFDEGAAGRELLRSMWHAGRDPEARSRPQYVIDQLDVGDEHVYVLENPAVSDDDLDYVIVFACYQGEQRVRSVQLETSALIREQGVPYVLGFDEGTRHGTTGPFFEAMPSYEVLRPIAVDLIEQLQAGTARPMTTSRPGR